MNEGTTSLKPTRGRHTVLVAGICYLLIYTVLALIFYKERCMQDAGYMLFEMVNERTFPFAQNRYIIFLLNILPVMSIKSGLSLKAVIMSWNLNYSLFYLALFLYILLGLKDAVSAMFVLFIHLFTMAAQNYNIADEIIPSAALMIVLISLMRSSNSIAPLPKFLLYGFLLFFTVFGHILVPIALILAAVYYMVVHRTEWREHISQFVIPAIAFGLFFIIRYFIAMKDPYERDNMSAGIGEIMEVFAVLDLIRIIEFIRFYFDAFTVCGILLIVLFAWLLWQKKWINIITVSILLLFYWGVWYLNLTLSFGDMQLSSRDMLTLRRLFPFNFIILFVLYDEMLRGVFKKPDISAHPARYAVIVFAIGLVIQFHAFYKLLPIPRQSVNQFYQVYDQLPDSDTDKYFLDYNSICPHGYYHSVYSNSILLTALKGPDNAKQIIYAFEDEIPAIQDVKADDIYIARGVIQPLQSLNKRYFNIENTAYKKVEVDLTDCPGFY